MPSVDSTDENIEAIAQDAFLRRIMQIGLVHRVDRGLDAVHVYRLQKHGLLQGVAPPTLPEDLDKILGTSDHAKRANVCGGPLLFVHEDKQIVIIELHSLILHPDSSIRSAALDVLLTANESADPWLTDHTLKEIQRNASKIRSDNHDEWREVGVQLYPLVRDDYLRHLGCLRTYLQMQHDDGIHESLERLLRPKWDELYFLAPPVLNFFRQQEEIRTRIDEFSSEDSLITALNHYTNYCGYVPLPRELSSVALANKWKELHPKQSCDTEELFAWARRGMTPTAVYHALLIEIDRSSTQRITGDELWHSELLQILGADGSTVDSNKIGAEWDLFCALATHFVRHIEAVHPSQEGDRIASLAWWLATKLITVLLQEKANCDIVLKHLVLPECNLSNMRWTIARSPVSASELRYGTLHFTSVWAMSMLAHLSCYDTFTLLLGQNSTSLPHFKQAVLGYLVSSPLGNARPEEPRVLMFQETSKLESLFRDVPQFTEQEQRTLDGVLAIRQRIRNLDEISDQLARLAGCGPEEQFLTLLLLRDLVYSTTDADSTLSAWIGRYEQARNALIHISLDNLPLVEDALVEYHQRQQSESFFRTLNLVCSAIENTDEEPRASQLFAILLKLSINGGVVSPIQRAMHSQWRHAFADQLKTYRDNLSTVSKLSEPWVRGRVRATCAAISRLIGPRQFTVKADEASGH